jgi:4-hydroxy-2-oxoheptanedioate aldolase
VKSTDPAVTEVLAGAGFGALVVDLEHSTLGPADVVAIVRAADTYGVPVVVRVGPAELSGVGRLLETGVAGIQVTEVESAVLLADIRRSVSFAPRGARSVALSHRAGGYGARSLADYLSEEPVTIAQIESRAGVAALPELLASDAQPDVWFIGPLDLSTDLGHPGEVDHRGGPRFRRTSRSVRPRRGRRATVGPARRATDPCGVRRDYARRSRARCGRGARELVRNRGRLTT